MSKRLAMVLYRNESGVSAVISVILLVAITVIIAAVIASFTLGMTHNIPRTKLVAAVVSHVDSRHVTVTYEGGQDANTCIGVQWVLNRADGTSLSSVMMVPMTGTSWLQIGTTKTFAVNWPDKKRVVATAYFSDNTQQVILDNTF
jgi:archaeal type IV pilus assembly protein PilA